MLWALCLFPLASGFVTTSQCSDMCQCDSEITTCQYKDLTELPGGIDFNVIGLDLSYNNFEVFPTGWETFSDLKYLNMSHNKLATLKYNDFQYLENLERLDLSFNSFHDWKDIYSSVFSSTSNLQFLDFSSNPLRTIPKYSNHLNIPTLQVLKLANCSMRSVPSNVFNRLTSLTELYLMENPISSINDSFAMENLKIVDFSRTRLSVINENVFANIPKLEILILNNNFHLKRISCNSEYLLYLDVSNCMLEKVPSGYMRKLVRLDLSGNFLKIIPVNSFINFPNLQYLNLSTNALTLLHDDAFEGLNEIINIDLSYNKLTILQEILFSNNSKLGYLNLSHNYINQLDTISSKSLKVLIASFCEVYELNRYSLTLMPNLEVLILSRNFITRIPDRFIAPNLEYLDMSYCRINTLNNETFVEMTLLRQLYLANNALTNVEPSYFPRVFQVDIKDNPWRCDCQKLKRMFEWMAGYQPQDLGELLCNSPEKVEGRTWEQACDIEWYPNQAVKDTLWYYSLGIVIAMVLALFALVVIKKFKSLQEQRIRLEAETRRDEEREALRRMQDRAREIEEDENRNAPDPRELQGPPSYSEAILLPRVDASNPNLAGSVHSFGSRGSLNSDSAKKNRVRRKRRRRKSEEERRASRITVDSDSSDQFQSTESLSGRRYNKTLQAPPLESDF